MSLRLQSELQDLDERYGVKVGDMTADEIERLVLACRRAESPFSSVNAELVEAPFRVCRGVWGWPMTIGAMVWLSEFAGKWWPDGAMGFFAQVYAMIHAREKDAFASLTEKGAARRAIMKTALRLVCHRKEAAVALERCYHADEDVCPETSKADAADAERAQSDLATLVARLEVESGISADEWLWGRSFAQAMECYTELHRFAAAYSIGAERTHMKDELDEAINDLQRLKAQIGRRVAAERKGKGGEHKEAAE
jgi:hypothetical protein